MRTKGKKEEQSGLERPGSFFFEGCEISTIKTLSSRICVRRKAGFICPREVFASGMLGNVIHSRRLGGKALNQGVQLERKGRRDSGVGWQSQSEEEAAG